ncbi:MAG: MerR family transcriptional regulator [Actinobacteria bacterium]|nr:MerR family transcriptional regulator [Actinomycetota bacterium]
MQPSPTAAGSYRIGELARRVGLSEHVLRAWERRYEVVRPTRTPSGYRLYSTADEQRLRQMIRLVQQGMPPAEAARAVLSGPTAVATGPLDPATARLVAASRRRLRTALFAMAEPRSQAVLDEVLAVVPLEVAIARVLLPVLREIGEGWQDGQVSVAQEHFATAILRGRLAGLARGWGERSGPRALLACPPDERHDLGLLMFGLLLARRGWSISYLGADTPISAVSATAEAQRVDVVVLAAVEAARLAAVADGVRELAARVRVVLAGPGAAGSIPGVQLLTGDLVESVATVTEPAG